MKKIGILTRCQIEKAKKTVDFADEIICIENIGPDELAYGQAAFHDRLKVTYIFNGKKQFSIFSGQSSGSYKKEL